MRDKIFRSNYWPGHKLGEERHIECIVKQVGERLYLSTKDVNRIAEGLEREKRYANREEDIQWFKMSSCQRCDNPSEEVGVFEIAQQSQIYQ